MTDEFLIQKIHEIQTTLKNVENMEKILIQKAAQNRAFEKHFKYPTQKIKSTQNSQLEFPVVPILNSKEIKTEPGEDMENVAHNENEMDRPSADQNSTLEILNSEQKPVEQNKISKKCALKK